MKQISPATLSLLYTGIGALFIFLSVQHVKLFGWNFFSYFLIALSASDIFIAIRFFIIFMQQKNNKNMPGK